jgi:uncharacterized protein (DUF2062 family)
VSPSKRILISIVSFVMAIMFAVPNLVILVAILLTFISKAIAMTFCLVFAWNIAKLVEHFHRKSTNE